MFISEYFSRPLTLISVMEKINFVPTSDLVVHVLGANYLELSDVSSWELILHWIPKVERLKIVLIGPELPKDKLKPELCTRCSSKKKCLTVEVHDAFYHNYMAKGYSKPNLVIGYNVGIAESENPGTPEDTWKPTILSLPENQSPFILTAYTVEEARKDHKRICLILGDTTNYSCFEKNSFASLKPLRDFETEGIFVENNYIIIYDNLQNAKSGKDEEARSVQNPTIRKANSEGKNNANKKENKVNSTTLEKKNDPQSNSSSGRNKKVSVPSEKTKTVSSTEISTEELKEENKCLAERMKRLRVAIEEEKQGIKIAPERKNLIGEVANIEESMKREIRELRDEIMKLNVDH